ncbi:hypothetical protein ACQZ61_16780 [Agrobacterium vitis]|uniref:hypothetical protein n=1 Tax=Agrobacterium vitis TaxID=373 RepID=UPI0015DAF8A6|nr:hypothetical protein [Agrobacterium vitis]MCF1452147.1 hypothetical protein [Agrobacterium vitis]BCH52822.1 hypothetical protein RvVAR031_04320 [Agrobacterium vitis]
MAWRPPPSHLANVPPSSIARRNRLPCSITIWPKYYHAGIAALHDPLGNEETRALAADKLRTLVSRVDLVPDGAELVIVLRGDLAAVPTFASGKRKPEFLNERAILEDLIGRASATGGINAKIP